MVRGGNRLEPSGLAEVVYFGIKTWIPPSSYRATLPVNLEKEITELWPDLISAVLDEMRALGAITLGRGSNEDFEFELLRINCPHLVDFFDFTNSSIR